MAQLLRQMDGVKFAFGILDEISATAKASELIGGK